MQLSHVLVACDLRNDRRRADWFQPEITLNKSLLFELLQLERNIFNHLIAINSNQA